MTRRSMIPDTGILMGIHPVNRCAHGETSLWSRWVLCKITRRRCPHAVMDAARDQVNCPEYLIRECVTNCNKCREGPK
jgi:hypothetical protein